MTTHLMAPKIQTYDSVALDLVRDFGADNRKRADNVAALNAFWTRLKELVKNNRVPTKAVIPPGEYLIDVSSASVNWTALVAFNCQIEASGAVFFIKGANKNGIDMLGCRGVHLKGLMIIGDAFAPPLCGISIGPVSTNTCGNNYFEEVYISGYFTKAAFWNSGSETTNYDGCWFVNSYADSSVYAYLGDGANRFSLASDHQSVRSSGTAVSYTNNSFSDNCRLECANGGGVPFYGEGTVGWFIDDSTYFLGYGACAIRLRNSSTIRNANMVINGLFETTQGNGLDYAIEFQVPNGENSAIEVMDINLGAPHCSAGFFNLVDPSAGTPGNLILRAVRIKTTGPFLGGSIPLFENGGGTLEVIGQIWCKNSASINLAELADYALDIYTDDADTIGSMGSEGSVNFFDAEAQADTSIARTATAASYTAKIGDEVIAVTSTASARTITLPPSGERWIGRYIEVVDESLAAGTNNITVDGNSANIDGAGTKAISNNGGYWGGYWTGSFWKTTKFA